MHIIKDVLTTPSRKIVEEIKDHRSLSWLFFSHQGRRYCASRKFPSLDKFRQIKEDVHRLGVYVDAGEIERANDANVGLIGSTTAILFFSDNTKVYKIILMHGAKAKIVASNYTVILLANMDQCDVEIEKDDTVLIL